MNTKNYLYHYDFVVECLGWTIDLGTFDRETYFADSRKNLAGSIIAHDYYAPNDAIQGIFAMEFWPTDPVAFELVELAHDLILANMPFARDRFCYHAAGETQRALYDAERESYEASSMAVIQTEDLYANVSYTPLTLGESYGRLRIIEGAETVSVRDIVVHRTLPNTLSHVAGIITEVPQTPLSHINLKAKQNSTPDAYIRGATTLAEVVALAGRYVRYSVQVGEDLVTNPEAYSIPDEFLVADLAGVERYEIQYIRHSNLVPDGRNILTKAQIFELADKMALIQSHFRTLYEVSRWDLDFAMDIEFKITADGRLNIKQARPWVE